MAVYESGSAWFQLYWMYFRFVYGKKTILGVLLYQIILEVKDFMPIFELQQTANS